MFKCTANVT